MADRKDDVLGSEVYKPTNKSGKTGGYLTNN
jgi:hypothetical protein